MSKRNRTKRNQGFFTDNFWQSANFNERAYVKNLAMLTSVAINRFKWLNLPDTCDARYLETQLHRNGIATLCHPENMPDVWQTLIAAPYGEFDAYGVPVKWRATGYNETNYDVTRDNGELCYYSYSRTNPWNALEIFARKMTHYERTEDINLSHQHKPWVFLAKPELRQQLVNLLKQVEGGEPAVLGTDTEFASMVEKVTAIDTKVPLVTEELARSKQNVWADAMAFLGVPHLAFEKGERMIEDEARANTAPTELMLLDCLQARRDFCDKVNERFGLNVSVVFNVDLESYNYNYLGNVEAMAQDGYSGIDETEVE